MTARLPALVEQFVQWFRLRGRSALVVVGALDDAAARRLVERVREGDALPIPVDAGGPWRADTLVVIGRIPRKLVAPLAAARRQLDTNGLVLAFDSAAEPHPALLSADAVIDVDVLVRGLPPDDDTLRRALDALTTLPVRARSTPAVVEPVVGEAP